MKKRLIPAAPAAAMAVAVLVHSAGPAMAALDCNSELTIGLPGGIAPGDTFPVTLTVVNGPSTDIVDQPVLQSFQTITFWPSCTSTLPCVPDSTLPVSFVGPVSTTCSVDYPWTATELVATGSTRVGTEIQFTFSGGIGPDPSALTLPAAASSFGTTSCNLVFNVTLYAEFTGTIAMQASTQGVCDPAGLQLISSSDATADMTFSCQSTVVSDSTVGGGATTFESCRDFIVGPNVTVTPPGDVRFFAGQGVSFLNNFEATANSLLTVGTCGRDLCTTGPSLDAACMPCVTNICFIDPFCCATAWDNVCVGRVSTVCGLGCP